MTCPACTGPATVLGALGRTTHYRCRDCGWQWSKTKKASARKKDKQ